MTRFLVHELYRCLQGEGMNIGMPSILVRFQICNLRCKWCDTPQAQGRSASGSIGKYLTTDELVSLIRLESAKSLEPIRHVIFSGGEPTIQPLHILRKALGSDWTAEVETNGTRIPHIEFPDFSEEMYSWFQWNVSPKGTAAEETICPEALEHWGQLAQKSDKVFLKCVVRESYREDDLSEILGWQKRFSWPKGRVFLMPEGVSRNSQVNAVWLHDLCIEHNMRMAPRLHVVLFESKKGV